MAQRRPNNDHISVIMTAEEFAEWQKGKAKSRSTSPSVPKERLVTPKKPKSNKQDENNADPDLEKRRKEERKRIENEKKKAEDDRRKAEEEKKKKEDEMKEITTMVNGMDVSRIKALKDLFQPEKPGQIPAHLNISEFGADNKLMAIEWIRSLEERCNSFNISPTRVINLHLSGRALAWYRNLEEDIKGDWTALKQAFLDEFSLTTRELKQKIKEAYKKQKGETVEKFASRLIHNRELLRAAGEKASDEELCDDFVAGLRSETGELGAIFRQMFAYYQGTYKEAFERALIAEEDYKFALEEKKSTPGHSSSYIPSPIKMLSDQVRVIIDQQTKQQASLARLESSGVVNFVGAQSNQSPNFGASGSQEGNNVLGRSDGKRGISCYYCGKPGHMKRDCRKRARDLQTRGKGNATPNTAAPQQSNNANGNDLKGTGGPSKSNPAQP